MRSKDLDWPANYSEIGKVIYNKDWSNTPLGAMKDWPQSLRTALTMCLASNSPMNIFWGEELIFLYNDAWSELLGDKHPGLLGKPARVVLDDSWETIGSRVRQTLTTGKVTEFNHQHVSFSGGNEHLLDFSFSPIPDETGSFAGIMGIATKTTEFARSAKDVDKGLAIIDVVFDKNQKPVDWVYLKTDQEYEVQTGLDNVEGKQASDLLPDVKKELIKAVGNVAKTGKPAFFENYNEKIKRWFEISAYRIGNPKEGKVALLVTNITERKQKELNNALLSAIVEGSDDAIISKDLNSRITSWNDSAKRIFGYTEEEAIGQPVTILFPEELIKEEDEILSRIQSGERIDHYETVRQRKDGTLLDVSLTISPIRDSEGTIVGASKIARNITGRKQKELNNALLSAIVEGSDDAIISKDLNSRITSWNDSAERIFGYTEEEAIGQPVTILFPEELMKEEDEILARIRNGERIEHYETVRQRKDGTLLDVSLTISPIRDSGGTIVGASKIARDITERKQNRKKREQLLQEVEAERKRLAEIFQHAPSFMCILREPDHIFERANDLYHKLVGDRAIIGKPLREALPETVEQGFVDLLDQVYETGESYSATEQRILLEQGEGQPPKERYLDFVYQPYRNARGEVVGIFVQGVDLTERKRAKEKLQEINATLEERVEERTSALLSYQDQLRSLAAKLSKAEEQERHRLATELHDNLGQMLAVNKMKMDLLQKDQLPDRTAREIEEIKQGMNDALVYTRDLMSDLKPPPTLDKEDVRATINWLAQKMQKHDLKVVIDDKDGQPKRTSEEIRTTILQCVRELLFNILKHSGVKEALIHMSRQDNDLHIVVEDQGQGFDPESERTGPSDNGGFGLFNIRERIDLLGGSMDISSEPGEGTRVTICAPLYEEEVSNFQEESSSKNRTTTETKNTSKIKVLLADDHQMFREGLKKLVHEEQDMIVVGEASSGREAVELAEEMLPDIIMMDVSMPEMSGIEATRKILSSMPGARIVGLSSMDDYEGVKESMLEAGASAYLAKSEAMETLCATIRSEAKLVKKQE